MHDVQQYYKSLFINLHQTLPGVQSYTWTITKKKEIALDEWCLLLTKKKNRTYLKKENRGMKLQNLYFYV